MNFTERPSPPAPCQLRGALPARFGRQRGFALILALSLMSFVLVIVLSLVLMASVETANAANLKDRLLARENARLGLMIALGELQKHLGPDQRVTARADILGSGNFHPDKSNWTGVWDEAGNLRAWLSSGDRPIDEGPSSSDALLVGENSAGNATSSYVRAPLQPIQSNSLSTSEFAFYVSDESMKVSVGKYDKLQDILADPASYGINDLEAKRLAQSTPGRPRSEFLFPQLRQSMGENRTINYWHDVSDGPSIASRLDRATGKGSFTLFEEFTAGSSGRGREASNVAGELQKRYHDITYQSKGLLVDPVRGGLKRDLSDEGLSDSQAPFPLNDSFKEFITQRTNDKDHAAFKGVDLSTGRGRGSGESFNIGDPINPVPLVMTEFALYVGVFRTGRYENSLELSVAVRADVWNPFATNLGFTPRGEDDFLISVSDLPVVTVTWETGRGTTNSNSGSFDLDLSTLNFSKDGPSTDPFTLSEVPYDIYDKMAVGEVRTVVEWMTAPIPDVTILDEGNERSSSDDFVTLNAPESNLIVEMKEISGSRGRGGSSGKTIQLFENIRFEALNTDSVRERNLVSAERPNYDSDFQAVFHFKFEDDLMLGDLERWASETDPRTVRMNLASADLQQLVFVNEDPAFAALSNNKFMGRPEFFYGGSGSPARNYHRFFDYPARDIVSVGFLQHLAFFNTPPFSIGNPWGRDKNAVFDRYFFSAYKNGKTHSPHLIEKQVQGPDPLDGSESAARYEVAGAFNLNSTSAAAWSTVLSGIHLYDWDYRIFEEDTYGGGDLNRPYVQNGIFRFPHHADRTFAHPHSYGIQNYPEITQAEKGEWYRKKWQPDWAAAFTTGMRELRGGFDSEAPGASSEGSIDDVAELAEAITDLIKERGSPYTSIEELLTEPADLNDPSTLPLLQEAIDRTRINTVSEKDYKETDDFLERFPRYAASFLTQADVINVLAPYAQVRGDTFVIRSVGQLKDASGRESAKIYCEAIVQRTIAPINQTLAPEDVDFDDPPTKFGRKFEIIDVKWLSENEI
ncbi:MAG: hypothetical protein GVY36_00555 [Verrucomicrobia bacterium]|jgi:hypothetical protein|nr:hypothetical protein [Verrucomicrobiota bacterium]